MNHGETPSQHQHNRRQHVRTDVAHAYLVTLAPAVASCSMCKQGEAHSLQQVQTVAPHANIWKPPPVTYLTQLRQTIPRGEQVTSPALVLRVAVASATKVVLRGQSIRVTSLLKAPQQQPPKQSAWEWRTQTRSMPVLQRPEVLRRAHIPQVAHGHTQTTVKQIGTYHQNSNLTSYLMKERVFQCRVSEQMVLWSEFFCTLLQRLAAV